jgi:hypothetical protein
LRVGGGHGEWSPASEARHALADQIMPPAEGRPERPVQEADSVLDLGLMDRLLREIPQRASLV